jgi:hypothetical protein
MLDRNPMAWKSAVKRRDMVRGTAALALIGGTVRPAAASMRACVPGDPAWPSQADWQRLRAQTGGWLFPSFQTPAAAFTSRLSRAPTTVVVPGRCTRFGRRVRKIQSV